MSEHFSNAARCYTKLVRAVPDALVVQVEAARAFTRLGAVEDAKKALGQVEARLTNHVFVDNISIDSVPEPSSAALLGLGGIALILRRLYVLQNYYITGG